MKHLRNSRGGTNTVELGPALFILCVLVLFPAIDMMYMMMQYAAGWYLNHLVVRECACHDPTNSTSVAAAVGIAETAWKNSMLAAFCNGQGFKNAGGMAISENITFMVGNPPGSPSYNAVPGGSYPPVPGTAGALPVDYCNAITTFPIHPLFLIPFCNGVPGLGADFSFVFADIRPQEEKGIH